MSVDCSCRALFRKHLKAAFENPEIPDEVKSTWASFTEAVSDEEMICRECETHGQRLIDNRFRDDFDI